MTQDEIIEMAQECNLIGVRPHLDGIYSESLVAFANLVAAKEREACAKVCEQSEIPIPIDVWHGGTKKEMTKHTALALANAIRAREQA